MRNTKLKKIRKFPLNDNTCGWIQTLEPRTKPIKELEGDLNTDFLIVGAGFTGLALAHRLAELQPQSMIVLLDAQIAGEGAASRNSGFLVDSSQAAGEKLSFKQDDIQPFGHAMECRIYAEDGFNNFSPSTGIIREMTMPHGLGVRLDEGVRTNQEITPYYDPLLGKLITWGDNRQTALDRMCRALNEFHIAGIESTIPFCHIVLLHPTFQRGKYNTHTVDAIKEELRHKLTIHSEDHILAARIGAVKLHHQTRGKSKPMLKQASLNQWTAAGRKDGVE